MATQLSAHTSFQDFRQVQSQPGFVDEPPDFQFAVANDFFNKNVATQPGFDQEPPEFQEQVRQQFFQKYNVPIPEVRPATGGLPGIQRPATPEPFRLPEMVAAPLRGMVQDYQLQMGDVAHGLQKATLGYGDMTQPFQGDMATADPAQRFRRQAAEFTGMALPYVLGDGALAAGAKHIGAGLAPYTTSLAKAAGANQAWMNPVVQTANFLGGNSLLSRMSRDALLAGGIGAARNQPNDQRLQSGLFEGAIGAAFPPALAGAGKVLKGGVKAVQGAAQEMFGPTTQQLLEAHTNALKQAMQKEAAQALKGLEDVFEKLKSGDIDHTLIDPEDFVKLSTQLSQLGKAVYQGLPVKREITSQARNTANRIIGKAKLRALKQKRPVESRAALNKRRTAAPKTASPFSEIPAEHSQNPNVIGYVNKTIAEAAGLKEGAIVFSNNVAKHLRRHFKDFAGLNAFDEKEYLEAIIRLTDEAYTQGKNKIVLVVKDQKGHIAPIELINKSGVYEYKPSTAFSPADFPQKYASIQQNGKLLWRRSEFSGSPGRQPSSHAPTDESPGGQHIANGQSSYSQDSTSTTTPQVPTQLTGSVKAMTQQVAKAAGLPENAGSLTAGQLEKQMGQKLTDAQKDIHTNLRAVARAEVQDPARGVQRQLPLDARALKFEAVQDDIAQPFQASAKVIDDAMGQGKAVRVEYVAEEAGRSREAAKITATGNVKVETTTFTPLYWSKTKDGKVLLHGNNQRGFFTTYHLEPSSQGSQVLKAKATDKAPFVGEYANVYLGERPFLAKDVLGRGVRTEGLVKTSEAAQLLSEASTNLDKVFTLIDSGKLSPGTNQVLKELRDAPKWGRKELGKFQMMLKNAKDRNAVCDILNLPH